MTRIHTFRNEERDHNLTGILELFIETNLYIMKQKYLKIFFGGARNMCANFFALCCYEPFIWIGDWSGRIYVQVVVIGCGISLITENNYADESLDASNKNVDEGKTEVQEGFTRT